MIRDKFFDFLRLAEETEEDGGEKNNGLPDRFGSSDLFELAGIGLWVFDVRGETTYANKAIASRLGYSREEMLALPMAAFTGQGLLELAKWQVQRRKLGITESCEVKLLHRDGFEVWADVSSAPMFDRAGAFLGAACILSDITERKRSEHSLRESEERYRSILESMQDGYFECDMAGMITFCNDAFCRIHGYSREACHSTDYRDYLTPENAQRTYQAFHQVYLTGHPLPSYEIEVIKPDGTVRYLDESVSLIRDAHGQPTGFRGVVRDITARRLTEEAVRESEQRFRTMANQAPAMIWMTGPDGRCTFVNQQWLAFTGRTMGDEAGLGWLECLHADDVAGCQEAFYSASNAGQSFQTEFRARRHDGVYRCILSSGTPRYASNGEFLGYIGSCVDITERKEAEEALRQSEERYRTILETINDGYFETNLDGRLMFVNDGLVKMFGHHSKNELVGLELNQFTEEPHTARLRKLAEGVYHGGSPVASFVCELKRPAGVASDVDMSLALIKDDTGCPSGFRGIIRDVTQRKRSETLIEGQIKVLEMIATGAQLKGTLEAIVRLVEELSGENICSILLLDEKRKHLHQGAALSLPEEYVRAIEGVAIGPCVGSCGTAAYTGQTVIVTDIAQDPIWAGFRDLALSHGLRACWSVPIFSTARQVLGTFALYHHVISAPEPEDVKLIETLANLASIAIERFQSEAKLQASEARFRALTEKSGEGITLIRPDTTMIYTSPAITRIAGYDPRDVVGTKIEKRIHQEDLPRFREIIASLSEAPGSSAEFCYRSRHGDGNWHWMEMTITNLLEEPSVQAIILNYRDITERKKAEDALRISEERFAKAFSASPEPMCLLTFAEGRFLFVNDAWVHSVGLKREEVVGRTSTELGLQRYPLPREQFIRLLKKEGHLHDLEVSTERPGGQMRTQLFSYQLLELDGQEAILAVSKDISERKRMEELLRASEERFAKAFNASPQPMAILELPSRKYTNVNLAMIKGSGWTAEEIIGCTPDEINIWCNPQDPQLVAELLAKQGAVHNMETSFRMKNGEIRSCLYSAEQIVFDGHPHLLIVANDITERKIAEEALRQNQALLYSVIESNPDWIFVKDLDHRYKLVNQSYADALHMRVEDFAGKNDLELGFPEDQVKGNPEKGIRGFWPADREVFATGQTQCVEEDPAEIDGQTHIFNTIKVPLKNEAGQVWGVLGVGRDLTKLRKVEAELRASEERFAKAFKASPQPMVIFEASERRIISLNEAMVRTFGWTAEEMIGRTPADLNIWVDLEQQSRVRTLLGAQGFVRDLEIKFYAKSGEIREFLYSAETINLENRPHVLVVVSDITDRLLAERALQQSEQRYRLLFEHGFTGIAQSKLDGKMLDCNDALAQLYGFQSREEMLNVKTPDLYFDQDESKRLMENLERYGSVRNYERLMKRRDGAAVWTLANITLFNRDGESEPLVEGVILDITERKLIEQELAQSYEQLQSLSARMEKVREEERTRIAREIHDNLGQTLTGLKMDFSWIERSLLRTTDEILRGKASAKLREIAQLLDETIQTVRDIATELRPGLLDTLGLCAAIDWQAREFEHRSGIECNISLCQEPRGLRAEQATALFRVFQEILTNIARHSGANRFKVKIAEAGGELTLSVKDDGIGITDEQLRHHKSLGLIGMRERVLAFGGTVQIEGLPGRGTAVEVKMPISQQPKQHCPPSS